MVEMYLIFEKAWKELLKQRVQRNDPQDAKFPDYLKGYPHFVRHIRRYDAQKFVEMVNNADEKTAFELVDSVLSGDIFVLKGAYTEEEVDALRNRILSWRNKTPQAENEKIVEGRQDFHKVNNVEMQGDSYNKTKDHPHVFFRWNGDNVGAFKMIDPYWEAIKIFSGLPSDSFIKSTPKDGVIDKLSVFQYPLGFGKITKHRDPPQSQKLLLNMTLNKRGRDFAYGESGFYLVDGKSGKNVYVENIVEYGSYMCASPSLHHGAQPPMALDGSKNDKPEWETEKGRGLLAAISVPSHHVEKRDSTVAVNN